MRRVAITCTLLLLAACAPREPLPEVAQQLREFDMQYAAAQARIKEIQTPAKSDVKDFRGRTQQQDFVDWVFNERTRADIQKLREEAAEQDGVPPALDLLKRADTLVEAQSKHANEIVDYWTNHSPAPFWRSYWDGLYRANGLPPGEPDSMLLKLEETMSASLGRGDFAAAGLDSEMLLPVFYESLSRASSRIMKERQPVLIFKQRQTPCVAGAAPGREQRRPTLNRVESPEAFYPPDALKRGEAGDVVMRARVDTKGCATAVAIVVHSGIDALDTAALKWFETAQFAPAFDDGRAQAGELAFKVKFVIQDKTQGSG